MATKRGGIDERRKRRNKIRQRYLELQNETPVRRVALMYEEFGPYWSKRLLSDDVLTEVERKAPRNVRWKRNQPKQ